MANSDEELEKITQQMLVDYTAWVNGQPVKWNVKKKEARQALLDWRERYADKTEMTAFLAGCLYAGVPDEDTETLIKAYKEWKRSQESKKEG